MKYLPNFLTSSRIFLLPFAIWSFQLRGKLSLLITLSLIIIMELSDLFDGMAARKYSSVSDMGKLFDPFADSIYRLTFFLFFYAGGLIPLWMFACFFYRDIIVVNLRLFALNQKNNVFAAKYSGKIKAVIQSGAIFIIVFLQYLTLYHQFNINLAGRISYIIMFITVVTTLFSGLDYLISVFKLLKKD